MKNPDSTLMNIRKIQRLRSARSFVKAIRNKTVKAEALRHASKQLEMAARTLVQIDSCVGARAMVVFSQLAIARHEVVARMMRDAEGFKSLAEHESEAAENELGLRRMELAKAQGALDVAEKIVCRAFQQEQARIQYVSDTNVLQEFVQQWVRKGVQDSDTVSKKLVHIPGCAYTHFRG